MKVKVLCLGRNAKEIEVDKGTTVEQAIQKAEMPKDSSYTRHVNGQNCMDSDFLNENDILTLIPQVKGGSGLSPDLLQFYAQKYHVNIALHRNAGHGIIVDYPVIAEGKFNINGHEFSYDADYQNHIEGEVILEDDVPVGKVSDGYLLFLFSPEDETSSNLMKRLLEEHLPAIAKKCRRQVRSQFLEQLVNCAEKKKYFLESQIRDKEFDIRDLIEKIKDKSSELFLSKHLLKFFNKSSKYLQQQAVKMFVELMKLVPGLYQGFRFEEDKLIGTTHPINIRYEGDDYNFEPYEVVIYLNDQKVTIQSSSNEINGYIHPHVTDDNEVCWGNIQGLIPKLLGSMDIFGLFQMIHKFLSEYNPDDPFQKIQNWDPYWEGEDEDEYCLYCEESGHNADCCEHCWYCDDCEEYHSYDVTCPEEEEHEAA